MIRLAVFSVAITCSDGPLGTFSAKVDVAFALGLLSEKSRRDLHNLRKVGNEFAHNPDDIDFDIPTPLLDYFIRRY